MPNTMLKGSDWRFFVLFLKCYCLKSKNFAKQNKINELHSFFMMTHISLWTYELFDESSESFPGLVCIVIWKLGVGTVCKRLPDLCWLVIWSMRNEILFMKSWFMISLCTLSYGLGSVFFTYLFISITHREKNDFFLTSYKEDCDDYRLQCSHIYKCCTAPQRPPLRPDNYMWTCMHLWTNGCIYPVGHMGRVYGIRRGVSTPAL